MKILKSAYHDQAYIEMNSPSYSGRYKVIPLPVAHCWPSVKKAPIHRGVEFYEPIKKDIQKNGMRHPIMVVHSTWKELIEQKDYWGENMEPLPFWQPYLPDSHLDNKIYVVWGGSNRWHIGMELGYTHIDCALMPSFGIAYELQKVMRAPYPQFYNGDPR